MVVSGRSGRLTAARKRRNGSAMVKHVSRGKRSLKSGVVSRMKGQRDRPRLFVSGAARCWSYLVDNLTACPDIVAAPAGWAVTMKKTWLPSRFMTKFWLKVPAPSVPVQSGLLEYVPEMRISVATPSTTTVPLPVAPPIPSATSRFTCAIGKPLRNPA
jgi:hypothetical protein